MPAWENGHGDLARSGEISGSLGIKFAATVRPRRCLRCRLRPQAATDADQASNGAKPLWKGTAMELPGGAAHGYAAKMPMRESTALVQAWPVREKSSPWISLRQ
jgi:hypothetical protein